MGTVMEVLVVLVCFSTVVISQQPEGRMDLYCLVDDNCASHSFCNNTNQCECRQGYSHDSSYKCKQCPGPNSECESCCYPANRYKCIGDHTKTCVCWSNCNDSFVLAAQVALGSALTIAFLALAALFWKTCPRRIGSNGHMTSLFRGQENSLTSMQRFILQRLRDRPPRYEDNNQIQLEKPPPYTETVTNSEVCDIRGISPSLYSETINTPASSNITEENKAVQPENISTTSHTMTWRASGDKQTADITVSDGTVDNIAFTLNEARHTHHSETELHM